ncbi:hypothetical protein M9458_054952 [Cirrhinus mrigala]|uniref:Uncharacterized protein n=1 Tax=Cirrhinus mrigala TaxID=683832 RepID=A0ABD0MI63_CIRMR
MKTASSLRSQRLQSFKRERLSAFERSLNLRRCNASFAKRSKAAGTMNYDRRDKGEERSRRYRFVTIGSRDVGFQDQRSTRRLKRVVRFHVATLLLTAASRVKAYETTAYEYTGRDQSIYCAKADESCGSYHERAFRCTEPVKRPTMNQQLI